MSSSSRRLEEDGKFGGSNLVRFFSLFFLGRGNQAFLDVHPDVFGKMDPISRAYFVSNELKPTTIQFFFDLYPYPKTHQPTPLFSKAALLPPEANSWELKLSSSRP